MRAKIKKRKKVEIKQQFIDKALIALQEVAANIKKNGIAKSGGKIVKHILNL